MSRLHAQTLKHITIAITESDSEAGDGRRADYTGIGRADSDSDGAGRQGPELSWTTGPSAALSRAPSAAATPSANRGPINLD